MSRIPVSTLAALEEMLQNASCHLPHACLPIVLGDRTVGHLVPDFTPFVIDSLQREPIAHLRVSARGLTLDTVAPAVLSDSLRVLATRMRGAGLIPAWRNEEFAFYGADGHEYFRVERAAFRTLGVQSQAAHINGFAANGQLWVGRRSESKQIDPGKLDNLAAGGISASETVVHCAIRELWEEAGIPEPIASAITPAGKLLISRPHPPHGIHHESLFIFDLELPKQLVPMNHDGEVSGFIQMDMAEAAARILADEFTADAGLVTADFILRRNRMA